MGFVVVAAALAYTASGIAFWFGAGWLLCLAILTIGGPVVALCLVPLAASRPAAGRVSARDVARRIAG